MTRCRAVIITLIVALGYVALSRPGFADMRRPSDPIAAGARTSERNDESVGPGTIFVKGLFFTYQRLAGPSKGTRCPMSPSCSEYAKIQVKQKGLLIGILEAGDRLHRCGHDLYLYEKVYLTVGEAREDIPN